MAEYEQRIKEAIEIIRKRLMAYHPQLGMELISLDQYVASDIAAQILSLVEIKSDDQSLPDNPHSPFVDRKFGTFGEGQSSLLKACFIKVIPKEMIRR